jgi:hypothetical protein
MRISSYFSRISVPFDGEIDQIDVSEIKNTMKVWIKFDSEIDVENQKRTLEEEIAKHYKLDKVTIELSKKEKPLTQQEVLDKILYSDDFEETLLELLNLKYQKAYKIGLDDCGLNIDILDIKIDSETFKALKKSGLRFYLNSKNTLNIKEMR